MRVPEYLFHSAHRVRPPVARVLVEPDAFFKILFIALPLFSLVGSVLAGWKTASAGDSTHFEGRPAGRCLVCRDSMADDCVECRACRTPHHRDCWDYVGRCAIYGCGSTEVRP